MTIEEKFWQRVKIIDGGCWEWVGFVKPNGYGSLTTSARRGQTKTEYAHRLSYRLLVGDIPDGSQVCHRCDNRKCVNPDHLFLGSQADNMRDMREKGRSRTGEKHRDAILTDEKVAKILEMYAIGFSQAMIGRRFGVSSGTVRSIIAGENWRHTTGGRNLVRPITSLAKLAPEDVREIRRLSQQGSFTQRAIAKMFGVGPMQISRIVRGQRWKCVS